MSENSENRASLEKYIGGRNNGPSKPSRSTLLLSRLTSHPIALPPIQPPWPAVPLYETIQRILERWQHYESSEVDQVISEHDDMYVAEDPEGLRHYTQVGRSALELITEAMLLARIDRFDRILDMPCGGGRVTRHLLAFFRDANISVADVDNQKRAFVSSHFGVEEHDVCADFSCTSDKLYDLIFVGSLVTHLPRDLYLAAVDYVIGALTPGGILVLTTHGRAAASAAQLTRAKRTRWRNRWAIQISLALRGFAYVGSIRERLRSGVRYGGSFNTASWSAGFVQRRADAMILGFKERAWADNQDVLIVQKVR